MPKKSVSTKDSIKLLNALWKDWTPKQREALLKARGLSKTWAKAKTIKEMVERGGGMIARSLLDVVRTYKKRNPQLKKVMLRK